MIMGQKIIMESKIWDKIVPVVPPFHELHFPRKTSTPSPRKSNRKSETSIPQMEISNRRWALVAEESSVTDMCLLAGWLGWCPPD